MGVGGHHDGYSAAGSGTAAAVSVSSDDTANSLLAHRPSAPGSVSSTIRSTAFVNKEPVVGAAADPLRVTVPANGSVSLSLPGGSAHKATPRTIDAVFAAPSLALGSSGGGLVESPLAGQLSAGVASSFAQKGLGGVEPGTAAGSADAASASSFSDSLFSGLSSGINSVGRGLRGLAASALTAGSSSSLGVSGGLPSTSPLMMMSQQGLATTTGGGAAGAAGAVPGIPPGGGMPGKLSPADFAELSSADAMLAGGAAAAAKAAAGASEVTSSGTGFVEVTTSAPLPTLSEAVTSKVPHDHAPTSFHHVEGSDPADQHDAAKHIDTAPGHQDPAASAALGGEVAGAASSATHKGSFLQQQPAETSLRSIAVGAAKGSGKSTAFAAESANESPPATAGCSEVYDTSQKVERLAKKMQGAGPGKFAKRYCPGLVAPFGGGESVFGSTLVDFTVFASCRSR